MLICNVQRGGKKSACLRKGFFTNEPFEQKLTGAAPLSLSLSLSLSPLCLSATDSHFYAARAVGRGGAEREGAASHTYPKAQSTT